MVNVIAEDAAGEIGTPLLLKDEQMQSCGISIAGFCRLN